MRTKVRVQLGYNQLDEVAASLIIHEVTEGSPVTSYTTVNSGSGLGQRVTGYVRQYLDISVKFAIAEKADLPERTRVLDRVCRWMNQPDWLQVSYRPGVRLWVRPLTYPARGNARTWNQDYTLVLRAYESPYWEDITPTVLYSGRITDAVTLERHVPGTAETELEIKCTGAVESFSATTGKGSVSFEGLGNRSGEMLEISRTRAGYMTATKEDDDGMVTSVRHCMTPESTDRLALSPGMNELTMVTDGSNAVWLLQARGRYL